RCDAAIAVTPYERDLFVRRGVSPARVVVSTNATDLERFDRIDARALRARVRALWGVSDDTAVVTFVGRKSPYKDIPVLVDAVAPLARTTSVVLVLLGPHSDWYDTMFPRWSQQAPLIDVRTVPETTKLAVLAASDVLVQPSRYEAFGIVFLEAWA